MGKSQPRQAHIGQGEIKLKVPFSFGTQFFGEKDSHTFKSTEGNFTILHERERRRKHTSPLKENVRSKMEKKIQCFDCTHGERRGMRKERTSHHSKTVLLLSQKLSFLFTHHDA